MRFTDLLRAASLLSAAAAAVLAAATVWFGVVEDARIVVLVCSGWWVLAAIVAVGIVIRRGDRPSDAVRRLLASAPTKRVTDPPRIGLTITARLWPLAVMTLVALVGGALLGPQVPGIIVALPVAGTMLWRGQEMAVRAIEERDGVVFHVVSRGPFRPIQLVRGPGLRRDLPRRRLAEPTPSS